MQVGIEEWGGRRYVQTNRRMDDAPVSVYRFRWLAALQRRRLNRTRLVPFYRWEIIRERRRYLVAAFENVLIDARPGDEHRRGPGRDHEPHPVLP